MKVELRLFTSLRNNRDNKYLMEIESGVTPMLLAEKLGIKQDEIAVVLINGKTDSISRKLNDGDIVSFFPSIGGG